MILTISSGRLELGMTKTEALQHIAALARSVEQSDKTGGAWFADGLVVEKDGKHTPARITYRVEG